MKLKTPRIILFRSCLSCGENKLLDHTTQEMIHFTPIEDRIRVCRTDRRWYPGNRNICTLDFAIECSNCGSNHFNYHIETNPVNHWNKTDWEVIK